ncbi:hypothetical protein [Gordonia sp. OPL2]|uniref:hypothetical protein n=1 Tax=Gordonia sp. OPL2 TaxID=2486274 RepID=UPI001654DF7C|nr:hypothetical protein [Gordonia sp. OPL2]RPA12160.1 hypothetical protein EEB19_07510 [Gordonia sp. OPL2]
MNLADQIEAIARRATAHVTAASNAFSETQRRLVAELGDHRDENADPRERLREGLRREADAADVDTPRLLLPADVAEASPHRPATDE